MSAFPTTGPDILANPPLRDAFVKILEGLVSALGLDQGACRRLGALETSGDGGAVSRLAEPAPCETLTAWVS